VRIRAGGDQRWSSLPRPTAISLVVQFHAEAEHYERRLCGCQRASSTADNRHCYLVDGGADKLCGLYSQGAVALDQCLPDERQTLVSAVSTCIWNPALGAVSPRDFQLVASSLDNCGPRSMQFFSQLLRTGHSTQIPRSRVNE
jgi:hypothetical protein